LIAPWQTAQYNTGRKRRSAFSRQWISGQNNIKSGKLIAQFYEMVSGFMVDGHAFMVFNLGFLVGDGGIRNEKQ
jgi:hypothetical protein